MRAVVITAEAERDLKAIHGYLVQEAPLQAACENLADAAMQYPLFPGRENRGVRRRVVRPYNVLYRVREDVVEVVHVRHGARDAIRILFPDD